MHNLATRCPARVKTLFSLCMFQTLQILSIELRRIKFQPKLKQSQSSGEKSKLPNSLTEPEVQVSGIGKTRV